MLLIFPQCVTTNASDCISHPNIPHMIAVSSVVSEHNFLVFNGGPYKNIGRPTISTQTWFKQNTMELLNTHLARF